MSSVFTCRKVRQVCRKVLTQSAIPLETLEYLSVICPVQRFHFIGSRSGLDPGLPQNLFSHFDWFTPNRTEETTLLGGIRVTQRKSLTRKWLRRFLPGGEPRYV